MKKHLILLVVGAYVLLLVSNVRAADAVSNETRLRDALRNALIQARTAENDRAVSEAEKADLKGKNEAFSKQVEALTKQARVDKEKTDKVAGDLRARVAAQEAQIGRLRQDFDKTSDDLRKSEEQAKALEAARSKLADDVILLQRVVADQKTKNREMYKLGLDILGRFEKFGLGEALRSKEPFVGLTRVKLQNYVQDLQDRLADQRTAH